MQRICSMAKANSLCTSPLRTQALGRNLDYGIWSIGLWSQITKYLFKVHGQWQPTCKIAQIFHDQTNIHSYNVQPAVQS